MEDFSVGIFVFKKSKVHCRLLCSYLVLLSFGYSIGVYGFTPKDGVTSAMEASRSGSLSFFQVNETQSPEDGNAVNPSNVEVAVNDPSERVVALEGSKSVVRRQKPREKPSAIGVTSSTPVAQGSAIGTVKVEQEPGQAQSVEISGKVELKRVSGGSIVRRQNQKASESDEELDGFVELSQRERLEYKSRPKRSGFLDRWQWLGIVLMLIFVYNVVFNIQKRMLKSASTIQNSGMNEALVNVVDMKPNWARKEASPNTPRMLPVVEGWMESTEGLLFTDDGDVSSVRRCVQAMSVDAASTVEQLFPLPVVGGYDCAIRRPLCSRKLMRFQARVEGCLSGASFNAPFSSKLSVYYSGTATHCLHYGLQPVTIAFAQRRTDFVVTLAGRPDVRLEVLHEEVSLFDMGELVESLTLAEAPRAWKQFTQIHQTMPMETPETEVVEFKECALCVGDLVTIVGELVRDPRGVLAVRPWNAFANASASSGSDLDKDSESEGERELGARPAGHKAWPDGFPNQVLISDDPSLIC